VSGAPPVDPWLGRVRGRALPGRVSPVHLCDDRLSAGIRVAGGVYCFTVTLADLRCDLLTRDIEGLRAAVRKVQARLPFHIDAWVVLPDHLHCMWTLPAGDSGFSARWQAIKTAFSKSVPVGEARSASRIRKGERGIWQLRFWEHTIYDDRDYGERHAAAAVRIRRRLLRGRMQWEGRRRVAGVDRRWFWWLNFAWLCCGRHSWIARAQGRLTMTMNLVPL
jgi:REP element-mobilizing transposase RayT